MSPSTSASKRISILQGWLYALVLGLATGCAEGGVPIDVSDGGTSGAPSNPPRNASGGADGGLTGTFGSTSTGTSTGTSSSGESSTGGTDASSTGGSGTYNTGMTSTAGDASTTGSTQLDGSVPSRPDDAGEEDPFADLFGDGGLFGGPAPSPDPDASMPPPTGGGEWALNPDSAAECPQEPPPIPLLGGPCLGIYYACGWTNQSGATYSCICDWVHWLCI